VYQDAAHLHGPLGLIFATNGNLLVANADPAVSPDPAVPSEIVEFTRRGEFVRQYSVDPNLGSAYVLGKRPARARQAPSHDKDRGVIVGRHSWLPLRQPRDMPRTLRLQPPQIVSFHAVRQNAT
jgi:hypothetical protein